MTCIGMIVPPADGAVPPEPPALYPDIRFIARGMGLPRLTPDGYDSVIDYTAGLARDLATDGAEAISLMGTSLSFYRGPDGNAQVLEAMRETTGLPVTTMTDSVLAALHMFKARRIAVATAYTQEVNDRLRSYLVHEGFDIASLVSLDLTEIDAIQSTGADELIALGKVALAQAGTADALFISCGGLRTLPTILPLEEATGIPVISSATAGAWGAVRLAGHDGRSPGFGRLFAA
jgi:arylmalonate decarboxylase